MRKLPEQVRIKQDSTRTDTSNKVQKAIDELIAEGCIVTRKLILERTGLSNSVLSKEHCVEVLRKNKVCQFSVKRKLKQPVSKDNDIELKKAYEDISKLEKEITKLKNQLNKQKVAYFEMKEDNEILRGKFHLLIQKAKIKGIDLDEK